MLHRLLLLIAFFLAVICWGHSRSRLELRADLTYVNPSDIHTLDPARMSWTTDFRVALNIWEGLTSWDPETLHPTAGAAFFPPRVSDDEGELVFTLRNDARWSNGEPVTADDFVRGWRRGIEPGCAADYAFLLTDHITGADEYVQWRQRWVSALTALVRLRDGWDIDVRLAGSLLDPEIVLNLKSLGELALAQQLERLAGKPDDALGPAIRELGAGWSRIHSELLEVHGNRLDVEFSRVGIRALDERTLTVQLSKPCPYFLDLTGMPVFLPCHSSIELLRERHGRAALSETGLVLHDPQWTKPDYHRNGYPGLITNGAFQLTEWTFKRRARMAKNLFFHGADAIGCRTIDMVVYDNLNAALMAYEAGQVDLLPDLTVPYVHELVRRAESGERKDILRCPVSATYFLNFNCRSRSLNEAPNPMSDPRVRRALSLSVDKEMLVIKVRARGDRIAHSFVPPDATAGYVPPKAPGYNPDESRRLLSEAGYSGGAGLPPISLLLTQNDERLGQALARTWERELGIRVELTVKESKSFSEDKAERRYMVARGNWFADYNDPTTFLNCLASGNGNNDSGYSNAEYDRLLDEANRIADPESRFQLLSRAEAIVVQTDFPIVPILHFSEPIAIKPYVHGIHANARLWFPFRFARVSR